MFGTKLTHLKALSAGARRTLTATAVAGGVALALVAAPMTSAEAAGGCSSAACVSPVVVTPGGQSLEFTYKTAVPTWDVLEISHGSVNDDFVFAMDLTTRHDVTSDLPLEPGRTYNWSLQETDKKGRSTTVTGTAMTLHRQVDLWYSTVTITNDSDANDAGELKAWDGANGLYRVNPSMPTSVSDGQEVPFADHWQLRDAGTTTVANAEVLDNDSTIPGHPGLQIPSPNDPLAGYGSSALWEWSTATLSLDTRNATYGFLPLYMPVNRNVGFVVHGYYSVTFVS